MKKLAAIVAMALTPLCADVRLFEIKHADVRAVAQVLQVFNVQMQRDDRLRAITVNASSEALRAIEEMIKRIDVPQPGNVETTIYLLAGAEQGPAGEMPADLSPVITQLRAISAYKSFRLMDTMVVRGRPAQRLTVSGIVPVKISANDRVDAQTHVMIGGIDVTSDEKGRTIRISSLNVSMQIPTGRMTEKGGPEYSRAGVETDIDIREGQKVVVGKSNMAGTNQSLILVLSARVTD